MAAKFRACEPGLNIIANANHLCVEYLPARRIIFSMTQQGNALSCHFAANKNGLRHLKTAINDFCEWAFRQYSWCRMIMAVIKKTSVERLVKKCGFKYVGRYREPIFVYARVRHG